MKTLFVPFRAPDGTSASTKAALTDTDELPGEEDCRAVTSPFNVLSSVISVERLLLMPVKPAPKPVISDIEIGSVAYCPDPEPPEPEPDPDPEPEPEPGVLDVRTLATESGTELGGTCQSSDHVSEPLLLVYTT